MQTLCLKDLRVDCILGDTPAERETEQAVFVSVELELETDNAAKSDLLQDTVDYAVLSRKIADALRQAKCRMLERAAAIVLQTCMDDGKVSNAIVEVEKRGTVPGLGAAKVRMSNK